MEVSLGAAIFLVVVAQRLTELAIARRNTVRMLARGARELGAAHCPCMVALRAALGSGARGARS